MAPSGERASHERYRERLAPWRAGLLEPDEERALREHVEACGPCAADWDEISSSPWGVDGKHIAPETLARWDRVPSMLGGLERAMVRQHLLECAECRADLQILGYALDLDSIAETETDRVAGGLADKAKHFDGRSASIRRSGGNTRPPFLGWIPWLVGGWATAATATAAFLIFTSVPRSATDMDRLPPSSSSLPTPVAPSPSRAYSPGAPVFDPAVVVALDVHTRGSADAEVPATRIRNDTRALVIGVPTEDLFDVDLDERLTIQIVDSSDQTIWGSSQTLRRLTVECVLVARSTDPLRTGEYRLQVQPDGRKAVVFRFRLSHDEP